MSSILTNTSAMNALQTLKSINKNLSQTQTSISTGKDIASAKDNSAIWAISKVMESDVSGFKAISDSLALGESTVAVARNAAETVSDLMKEIKGKVIASQEENVDRNKINTDIAALRDQITSVVGAAQFNGLNLINGEADSPVKVLSSMDRAADGSVSARNIEVAAQDLSQDAQGVGGTDADAGLVNAAITDGSTAAIATFTYAPEKGATYQVISGVGGMTAAVSYVANDGDTLADVNKEMVTRLNVQAAKDGLDLSFAVNGGNIELTNNTGADIATAAASARESDGTTLDGTVGGKLDLLADINVSSAEGAKAALAAIESLTQKSIDSSASFGSVEKRISIQNEFVGKLMDSMKAGIGSLVDADMEATSARLQALQTQQQLGVQALSIANQAPQTIMQLFR